LYRALFTAALQYVQQQTVDDGHAGLEIDPRSSYVPSAPIGVQSGLPATRP
jgi:hypothetical protein